MAANLEEESLVEIFNQAAVAYRQEFPQLERLIIVSTKERIYISPEATKIIGTNPNELGEIIAESAQFLQHTKTFACAERYEHIDNNQEYRVLIINTDIADNAYVSSNFPDILNQITLFDHEIGHMVVAEGGKPYPPHVKECAADAFAALRHIQRFGGKTDLLEHALYESSDSVLLTTKIHYTAAVFEEIKEIASKTDICSMSLKETAELAGKIAKKHGLTEANLDKIYNAFSSARETLKKDPNNIPDFIKSIVNVIKKHGNDADITKAGKLFLNRADVKKAINYFCSDLPELLDTMRHYQKPKRHLQI